MFFQFRIFFLSCTIYFIFRISSSKISTLEPVECVLFLSERDPSNFAPLVTAEGNKIKFWSTVATGVPTGNPRGESLIS